MKICFSEFVSDIEFNSGIAALSAFLGKAGHEITLVRSINAFNRAEYEDALRAAQPGLIAFSCMSHQWVGTQPLLESAKRVFPEIPTIVGGCHPTFAPTAVLSNPHVDFICVGEGELALSLLIEALEEGKRIERQIPGIWSKKDGEIIKNGAGTMIENLDDLPYWDREIFNYEQLLEAGARATAGRRPYTIPLSATRGCPWNCTYCSNTAYQRLYDRRASYHRVRSVSHVLGEIRQLKARYRIDEIEFWDEAFGLNVNWLAEFSHTYQVKMRGVPYTVLIRPEQTHNPRFLELLSGGGCTRVMLGVEAGNEEYRKTILHRNLSNQDIIEAVRRCHEHDIEVVALNMLGLPFQTPELMRETIGFVRRLEPECAVFFIFQPYPGTDLYETCKEQGWVPDDFLPAIWPPPPESVPRMALQQPSYTQEEFLQIHQEATELREELAARANSKRLDKFIERLRHHAALQKKAETQDTSLC